MRSKRSRAGRQQRLRRILTDRRSELLETFHTQRRSFPETAMPLPDVDDQRVQDVVRDLDATLLEMSSHALRKIEDALSRLDAGSFGICAECQDEIPETRIKALPFAECCVACQDLRERQRAAQDEAVGAPASQ